MLCGSFASSLVQGKQGGCQRWEARGLSEVGTLKKEATHNQTGREARQPKGTELELLQLMPTDRELLETDQVMYAPTSFQKAVDMYQLQKADI